ncbi:hypothetical protein [Nocardioides marinisabuli]|uniref:hypothetical protein n=1 Tax=Nocardioides marinisabuli TaxID=419476 RepID=UPI0015DFA02D|nr:hypothetical protein [Nocardioides marinisabuli]
MQEISVEQLVTTSQHRFARHQVDPAIAPRAWVAGAAAVVENHPRWTGPSPGRSWCAWARPRSWRR